MKAVDPVLDELIQSALDTAVEEGGLAAARAAGSPFVSGAGAIACAVFDTKGRLVAQTAGGLLHVAAMRGMLREVIKEEPIETIEAGDIFILNDHFKGGIHPTDVGIFRPVFHDGKLILFTTTLMIVSDLGGMSSGGLPANATEIFHEGLIIPVMHYYQRGHKVRALQIMIRANSRTPEKIIGDIDALVAGTKVAESRINEVVARYGADVVMDTIDRLIAYAEQMARVGIAAIPDGRYEGSFTIESDNVDERKSFLVCCAVTITGSDCFIDFTGTDKQARGAVNASHSQSWSAALYALRCCLDPSIPMNEGMYNTFSVCLPPGSLVNPSFPAACNLRMGTVGAMIGAINRALSHVFPDRAVAGGSAAITATISSVLPGPNGMWAMMDGNFGVGGGRPGLDGVNGTPVPFYAISGWERNVENFEVEYPVAYEDTYLEPDSGGAGEWRGGLSVSKHIVFEEDCWLTVRGVDGFVFGPPGAQGGKSGTCAAWIMNEGTAKEQRLAPKTTNHYVKAGDRLSFINAGGGGFGDPLKRDPAAVARDVNDGFVSREAALRDYGVEVDEKGRGVRKVHAGASK